MDSIETGHDRATADSAPLDRLLGSRSHIRVLRSLISKGPGHNVGVRDVAGLAGVSHSRVAKVLADMSDAGLVTRHETRWGPLFELNHDHYFAPQLFHLFDDELHLIQAIVGYVRAEARKSRRRVRLDVGRETDWTPQIAVALLHPQREDDWRWLDEVEEAIAERFGVEVRLKPG